MPIRTSNIQIPPTLAILGLAEIAIFSAALYLGGLLVYGSIAECERVVGSLAPRAICIAGVMLFSLVSVGLYQLNQRLTFGDVAARLIVAIGLGTVALAALFSGLSSLAVPPLLGLVSIAIAIVLATAFRFVFTRRVDENAFRRKSIIYGCGKRAATIGDLRRKADRRGFKIVACVPAPGDHELTDHTWRVVLDKPLLEIAEEYSADEIVIAMDDRRGNLPMEELLDCRLRGIEVIDLLEFLERESGKIRVDLVNPGWLIFSAGFQVTKFREVTKKAIDISLSAVTLAVIWPLFLAVAIAIKLEDGLRAPILYRQIRVGRYGNHFNLFKFRSMRVDAESEGQPVWADVNDARISRVGRVLRKYRIDELPQMFNVLRGEMSWIGPRPERPEFVQKLSEVIPYYAERHTVTPGITGWAQLRYAYGSSEKDAMEKLQYDLYYIKNQTVLLDLVILMQTFEVILWSKGSR